MSAIRFGLLALVLTPLCVSCCLQRVPPDPMGGGGHSAHHNGHKPIKVDQPFIALGKEAKTVEILIVAALTNTNHGMNFNGFSKGQAIYTVPLGWRVNVTFKNASAVPHSVVVVDQEMVSELQIGKPYFTGASSPDAMAATAPKHAKFSFIANEAGEYAFACGFPTHAAAGHWITLKISKEAKSPLLTLPNKTIPAK
jgi:plastocyanin